MSDSVTLTLDQAQALGVEILESHGYSPAHAAAMASCMTAAQRDACHSHGLYRLIDCVRTARLGGVETRAEPEVVDQAPGVVRVDARGGNSLLAFERGTPLLVEKARGNGVAIMAINRAFHFSALWPEVESLAEQGLVAMAMTPSHAYVAPAGGKSPLLGTNPVAFSWPRPDGSTYTFDFATSVVARGEVELHRRAGKSIPEGWGLDAEGHPTTDPEAALQGALLPFGGHKGSALSIMIELLAGPLIGDLLGHQTQPAGQSETSGPQHGEWILAMDPRRFLGDDTQAGIQRAEALFEGVVAQGARLPSQRRRAARQHSQAHGVTIPDELHAELLRLRDGQVDG